MVNTDSAGRYPTRMICVCCVGWAVLSPVRDGMSIDQTNPPDPSSVRSGIFVTFRQVAPLELEDLWLVTNDRHAARTGLAWR
jgi:hypothetical protein